MNQNARKDIKTLTGHEINELEHITMTKARESWHIFGIMSEFVHSAEQLANIRPAVSIFGSARLRPENAYYQKTEELARLLSNAGFSVISGGGGLGFDGFVDLGGGAYQLCNSAPQPSPGGGSGRAGCRRRVRADRLELGSWQACSRTADGRRARS